MTAEDFSQPGQPSQPAVAPDGLQERLRSPDRITTLSDGVFAIIMTILVLEIAVPPDLSSKSLRTVLEDLRPTFVAWVVSFLITGMYWVAHRDLFARLRAVNRDVVWLNLLFLVPASLIPFGAAMIGEYPDEAIALRVYGVVVIAVSVMRLVMYAYVVHRPQLLWAETVSEKAGVGFALGALPIVVYVIAMLVAEVAPPISIILFFAVPLIYFLAVTVLRERARTRSEAEDFS